MLRASFMLLMACAHPGPQRTIAPSPPARAEHVHAPELVFVADLSERRVGNIFDTVEGPVRNVFLIETASARQIEPVATRSGQLPTSVFTRLGPPRTGVLTAMQDPRKLLATVDYCVDASGHVISAHATCPNPMLERLAVETVLRWQFAPHFVNDRPVTACSSVALKAGELTVPRPMGVRRIETPLLAP